MSYADQYIDKESSQIVWNIHDIDSETSHKVRYFMILEYKKVQKRYEDENKVRKLSFTYFMYDCLLENIALRKQSEACKHLWFISQRDFGQVECFVADFRKK